MRKEKKLFHYPEILLIGTIIVFIFALVTMNPKDQPVENNISIQSKKIFYPKQFNDYKINLSAKETDPEYKDEIVFDRNSLIANIISTVTGTTEVTGANDKEAGTWLWTPITEITPEYRDKIILGAKERGVKSIYISIDSYLDLFLMPRGESRDNAIQKFDNILEDFIKTAHQNGIVVDAEAGWQNWAEPGNEYKPLAVLDYVIRFNKNYKEKFRGFQYDIEPYLLDKYQTNKTEVLYNYVYLIDETVAKLSNTDLLFSVTIPDFYNGENNETPEFSYRGVLGYTFDHLLSILERREGSRFIIMSYRNISKGNDGSIDISKSEITKADKSNTKVVIAQETGDVNPSYVTFWNTTKNYYDRQVLTIETAFSRDPSFVGIATHYINSYLNLQ